MLMCITFTLMAIVLLTAVQVFLTPLSWQMECTLVFLSTQLVQETMQLSASLSSVSYVVPVLYLSVHDFSDYT